MQNTKISIDDLDAIIFDFDGVLTDNSVLLNCNGEEFVKCSRSDGLGLDALRKINQPTFILSSEKNNVVTARGDKLKIPVIQGIQNKSQSLVELCSKNNYSLGRVLYVGNDLNDYKAMQLCGYSACPSDSHKMIKKISKIALKSPGGNGVVRELIEDIMSLNLIEILYE